MSYSSRVYRQRNPRSQDEKTNESFFGKSHDVNKSKEVKGSFFQAKLSVNEPGDSYEKEADFVANSVVNRSGSKPVILPKKISKLQRAVKPEEEELQKASTEKEEEKDVLKKESPATNGEIEKEKPEGVQAKKEAGKEEEDKETVQAKQDGSTSNSTTPQLSSSIQSATGKGKALPGGTLHEMSHSFGVDFSDVRIHENSEAANMNKELNAQAFTYGKDIFFDEGKFDPSSKDGKTLLAHELTHVVQQSDQIRKKTIQAYYTQDCNTTERSAIAGAVSQAITMLQHAIGRLSANPITAETKKLFGWHFGAYADWRKNVVLGYLKRDLDILQKSDITYECESSCDGEFAYTWWVFGDVHMCPAFYNQSPNGQANTMIHEIHHWKYGQFDFGYHDQNKDNNTSWPVAVNNADSYSALSQDLLEQP